MRRINPQLLIGLLVAVFFCVALCIRVFLPYDRVFSGDWIKFTSVDAYYYMRLVDNLAHNFPNITGFDPFFIYPGGGSVGSISFFCWFLSGIIWVIGLGSPSQPTVDVVSVFFPPVLAALTVIPVYFIGKELFNRWVGAIAAALIAIIPGEFLSRTILGWGDTSVVEILFTTTTVAFLILAIKTAGQRQLTFNHFIQRDWATITRPLVYSLLAGIFLGIYLLTWLGGLLFVFIITLYLIIQFIIDHLRHKSPVHLGIVGFILFLVALIIFLPFSPYGYLSFAVTTALFIPLVLSGVSLLLSGMKLKPLYYPLTLVGIGIVFIGIFYAVSPDTLSVLLARFRFVFFPGGATATTTMEMRPLLSPYGSFTFDVAWNNFNTSFFFSLISLLVILIHIVIKRGATSNGLLLFFIWSVVILAATLAQRRFAYYFAVNVALLTGYLSALAYYLIRFIEKRFRPTIVQVSISIWLILAVFLLAFFPNVGFLGTVLALGEDSDISFGEAWWLTCLAGAVENTAAPARFAPSDAWQASLLWMKENTPDPLGGPGDYYRLYEAPAPGEDYKYPESAYGVTSWWDYGYWITRTAHRLPSANPSQAAEPITQVAELFLSTEEATTNEIMEKLDSSYIMIDFDIVTGKFYAVAIWAGRERDEFSDFYYLSDEEGVLHSVRLFYPEYYQSLCVRLYNFDGKAVTDVRPIVISYEEKVDRQGNHYKLITSVEEFSSYEKALDYLESQGPANHRIVGVSRFISSVPLEAVPNYRLIYSSEPVESDQSEVVIPEVKIFEYIR